MTKELALNALTYKGELNMDSFMKYMIIFLLGFVLGPPLISHFLLSEKEPSSDNQSVIQEKDPISFTCKWFGYKCYAEE